MDADGMEGMQQALREIHAMMTGDQGGDMMTEMLINHVKDNFFEGGSFNKDAAVEWVRETVMKDAPQNEETMQMANMITETLSAANSMEEMQEAIK